MSSTRHANFLRGKKPTTNWPNLYLEHTLRQHAHFQDLSNFIHKTPNNKKPSQLQKDSAVEILCKLCLLFHWICSTSHPYKMSLSTSNLHGVNSRLLRSGTRLSTFKSTFWRIPCCHHRKFKRKQLDMYNGASTSVRIGRCAILQSDKWEASQNITLIWWTFNDQRMQLNHLIKRNVQKQLFISITFQMQPIILPIALKTIPHTFSAHYCPCRYLNTAISTHSKLSVL